MSERIRKIVLAYSGGLEAILVVNKLDLLAEGESLPDEIRAYEAVVELFPLSAKPAMGIERLRAKLANSTTVLAGHSGVGKSSLINALEPELHMCAMLGHDCCDGAAQHTAATCN